ncbi:TonB-dependent receptor [Aurantivibrio infirmus]
MKKNILHLAISAATVSMISGLVPASVFAQSGNQLEEIVITSERRESNLQDTPISATVLSADALFKKGIDNVDEIQQVAPSIAINTYNRSTFINIRGVGIAQSAPTSNPGVAYYLDGVFFPHEQFIGQSFFDLGSVEVLRGPQGTLTGQNSTGGALYVRSPAPDPDGHSGYIDQTVGTDGWYRTVGAYNAPTGGNSALRIAGVYENRDGFVDNLGPASGMDPGSSELISLRTNWALQPSDGQSYNVRLEYFDYQSGNIAVKDRQDTNPDPFEISYDGKSYLDQKGYRFSLEGRWDLSDYLQVRASLSDQDGYTEDQTDGDRSSTELASGAGRIAKARTDFETTIAEINLLSIGDNNLQWVLGAFFMKDDVPVILERDNANTADFVSPSPGSTIEAVAENTSVSLFGQLDASLTDALNLTVGVRYSDDEQVYTRFSLPGPPFAQPAQCFPCDTTQDSNETTGRIGLSYYVSGDTMLYSTLSKGYKAGGVNLDPRQGFFEPEQNVVLEAGVKTTADDGRLRFNANLFWSEYKDIQFASRLALFGPALPVTQNAASAEINGLEIEMEGVYDQFSFNAGFSYIESEFSDDICLNNTNALPTSNDPFCVGVLGLPARNELVSAGSDLPFTPKFSLNFGLQYEYQIGNTYVTPRFQVSFIEEQIATPFKEPTTTIEERTISDLKVSIEPNSSLLIEVFATNLFDEEYVASQIQPSSSADGGEIYGAPRQYGIRAKYDF